MSEQEQVTEPRSFEQFLAPVFELPNFQLMDDPDGQGRGEYVMKEVLEAALERQGFKIKSK